LSPVYGGPYPATSLEPSSSLSAAARKSFGFACDHDRSVTGASSGEPNSTARPTVSRQTTTSAITPSFTMS
jgi:hypothetical protein